MKRFLYLNFRVLYSLNRSIMRRFTGAGLLALGALMAFAVVGLDTNRTMAFQAVTFLQVILMISIIASRFFRSDFTITRILPRFGTVGEPLTYRILIDNKTRTFQKGLSIIENTDDPRPDFDTFSKTPEPDESRRNPIDRFLGYYRWLWLISQKQPVRLNEQPLPALPPNTQTEVLLKLTPLRRGCLRLTGLTVFCPDPFGLYKAVKTIPHVQSLVVLPKRYTLPEIRLPGSRRYQTGGMALASSVGESEEFVSLRDYRPGDPLRRIHWTSWAKTGKPIVKEYQDEFFVRHALVLDTFQQTAYSEVLEEAVSLAASFACTLETQDSLLDLIFVGSEAYCVTSGRSLGHTDNLLEILASVSACQDKDFNVLSASVEERAAMLSGCICILLLWDDIRQKFVRRLHGIGIPTLVFVIQPSDTDPMQNLPEHVVILRTGRVQEDLMSTFHNPSN